MRKLCYKDGIFTATYFILNLVIDYKGPDLMDISRTTVSEIQLANTQLCIDGVSTSFDKARLTKPLAIADIGYWSVHVLDYETGELLDCWHDPYTNEELGRLILTTHLDYSPIKVRLEVFPTTHQE